MRTVQQATYICVDMEVTRYREYPDDGFVQVFGYVGDYEISISLPLKDERAQKITGRGTPSRRPDKA